MARERHERDKGANTQRTSPAGEAEPHSEASPSRKAPRKWRQVSDAQEEDPEAPPWNFLFELPVALLILVAIIGLVIAFSR